MHVTKSQGSHDEVTLEGRRSPWVRDHQLCPSPGPGARSLLQLRPEHGEPAQAAAAPRQTGSALSAGGSLPPCQRLPPDGAQGLRAAASGGVHSVSPAGCAQSSSCPVLCPPSFTAFPVPPVGVTDHYQLPRPPTLQMKGSTFSDPHVKHGRLHHPGTRGPSHALSWPSLLSGLTGLRHAVPAPACGQLDCSSSRPAAAPVFPS